MRALAEGNSLRGTGRIVEVDKDTFCDWLDRAGRHCRAVTTYLFDNLHITECQLDESATSGKAGGLKKVEPLKAVDAVNRSKRFGCEPPTGGPSYHRSI
jgi:hypothetical protein